MDENVRNRTQVKMVLAEIGLVEIKVSKDRDDSFEPVIVPKGKRRMDGVGQIMPSLSARGSITGEIAIHFDEICGAEVSRNTISQIIEEASGELVKWSGRPLDPLYPVIFVDVVVVKVHDGRMRSTSSHVVMGVIVGRERDILGVWAGDGQEDARFWLWVSTEAENRDVENVFITICNGLKGSFGGDHTT